MYEKLLLMFERLRFVPFDLVEIRANLISIQNKLVEGFKVVCLLKSGINKGHTDAHTDRLLTPTLTGSLTPKLCF